jgi:hypothetical protein
MYLLVITVQAPGRPANLIEALELYINLTYLFPQGTKG